MTRMTRWTATAAALVCTAGATGCATAPDGDKTEAQPYYVTGSNIGRRDREVQRVQAVSGDALRKDPAQIGGVIAPPEGYRNAGN